MRIKLGLLVTTVCVGVLAMQGVAQATPYAYATNQFTNLTLTMWDGSADTALPVTQSNPSDPNDNYASGSHQNIYATASYTGYTPASSSATQAIPIYPTVSGLDINQATAGVGLFPGDNTFGQGGPGNFDGTRSDSTIGAGAGPNGAISISNVAEGNVTNGLGNSQGNNTATLAFDITVQAAAQVHLQFDYLAQLLVSTDQAGESANASIGNAFSIIGTSAAVSGFSENAPLADIANVNRGLVIPSSGSYMKTGSIDYLSSVLAPGTYQISLTSQAAQNVTGVPEPASLALLGAGLVGLGLIRSRRKAS